MKRTAIWVLVLTLSLAGELTAGAKSVKGTVFADRNGNGIRERNEKGVASVAVSDGFSVVLTDKDGGFALELNPRARFVAVYTPSGYRPSGRFYKDVRPLMAAAGGENTGGMDFGLEKTEEYGVFAHMSDIEDRSYNEWVEKAKDFAVFNDVDFIATTGDICYAKGLELMSKYLNDGTLPRRMVFSIGNHDLIGGYTDYLGNPYGEKLFEDHFGPSWYAFSVRGMHFLVTPMLIGDAKPSYSEEDIRLWIDAYLSVIPEGSPLILMNHAPQKSLIPEKGNVKAFIYGHRHTQYRRIDTSTGIPFYCTNPPSGAGNDHCPAALRLAEFGREGITSTRLRYFPISNHIAAHVAPMEGKLKISAAVYDAVSDAVKVVAEFPDGRKSELRQVNDFMWEAPADETARQGGFLVRATFANGNCIVTRVDAEPGLKWMNRIGSKPFLCNPIADGSHIYIATVDNENGTRCGICCLSAEDGSTEWFFRTKNSVHSDIALCNGVIYAGDMDYNIYALKASDGTVIWSRPMADVTYPFFSEGVTVDSGIVYFGTGQRLCALNAADGGTVWTNKSEHPSEINVGTNRIASGALLTNGYWRGRFCYDAASGEQLWCVRDPQNRYSNCTPAVLDTTFIYTARNTLFQVGARSGKVLKMQKFSEGFYVKSEPLITGDKVIVGTSDSGILGVNLEDFSKAWKRQTGPALIYTMPYSQDSEKTVECSPVAYGENVIVGANDGSVYCLNREKGAYIWHIGTGLPVLVKPVIYGRDLIVTDFAGNIYCYGLDTLDNGR